MYVYIVYTHINFQPCLCGQLMVSQKNNDGEENPDRKCVKDSMELKKGLTGGGLVGRPPSVNWVKIHVVCNCKFIA